MKDRKKDHIELAFESRTSLLAKDKRFWYEPMLAAHPMAVNKPISFLGKQMNHPIWISSMTGGTQKAGTINRNLAMACNEFGLGMGLGSCRKLLTSNDHFEDFNLRPIIGPEHPFWANLGIAQIEQSLQEKSINKISELINRLQCDGLIIHVNPFQEFFQPEGDPITRPPVESIGEFAAGFPFPLIVKEVGQGFGPESLKALLDINLAGIEFAAYGGTNFSKLELQRNPDQLEKEFYEPFAFIGHSANEMVQQFNQVAGKNAKSLPDVIISGGIKNYLDGFYLVNKINTKAVYGQASAFLKHAHDSYEELKQYVELQIKGFQLAKNYLKVKTTDCDEE